MSQDDNQHDGAEPGESQEVDLTATEQSEEVSTVDQPLIKSASNFEEEIGIPVETEAEPVGDNSPAEEQVDEVKIPELNQIVYGPNPNIHIYNSPLKYDKEYREAIGNEAALFLPSIKTRRQLKARLDEIDVKFAEVDPETVPDAVGQMADAQSLRPTYHADDLYDPMTTDDEVEFRQGMFDAEENKLYGSRAPKTKLPVKGTMLKGHAALQHIARSTGVGTSVINTLWSAGITVNFRPILGTEAESIEERIAQVKRDTAWATGGLTLSAGSSLQLITLLTELKQFIISTNYHTDDPTELFDVVDITDAEAFIAIAASTFFPNGVKFERACSNLVSCDDVASGRVFVERTRLDDNRKLTKEQIKRGAFSANGSRKFTYEETLAYKASHRYRGRDDTLVIQMDNGSELKVVFKVPSINEFIRDTNIWKNHLINTAKAALNEDAESGDRDKFLRNATLSSQCNQYHSWVSSFEIDGGIIADQETILSTLDLFQSNASFTKPFIAGIRKFIRAATVSVVCIPVYTCNKCKQANSDNPEDQWHPDVIVQSAQELFFRLATLRKMLSLGNIVTN